MSLVNQRFERIAAVTDFIKERKDRRVVRHKHRCKFSCSGRVTEAAENFTSAVVRGVQQRAASFCLVPQNPQVSAPVREMCSFVFNIQLPGPHVLTWIETEIISCDIFKEDVPVRTAIDRSYPNAAQDDRPLCVNPDTATDVSNMLDRDNGGRTVFDDDVRL